MVFRGRSGRVGRIGQKLKGRVLSILDEEGAAMLKELGDVLQFTPTEMDAPQAEVIPCAIVQIV